MLVMLGDVARETAKNAAMAVPAIRARRLARPRAGAEFTGADDQLERHALHALRLITAHLGPVRGKHVLEIGPGDYLTSALAMLAAGASTYTCIDRFVGDYSHVLGKIWYAGIKAAWPRLNPEHPWPSWLSADDFPEAYPDRVTAINRGIELARDAGQFDVVCSFQVGEHVTNIDAFARANAAMLRPGGAAIHRIDFGPHDCWRGYRDPLTFLRFPDPLWRAMGSNRGTPNRRRLGEVRAAFERTGLTVDVVDQEFIPINAIRFDKLPRRLRAMPEESVTTRTAILVCTHRSA
jgi:hypothetical protein